MPHLPTNLSTTSTLKSSLLLLAFFLTIITIATAQIYSFVDIPSSNLAFYIGAPLITRPLGTYTGDFTLELTTTGIGPNPCARSIQATGRGGENVFIWLQTGDYTCLTDPLTGYTESDGVSVDLTIGSSLYQLTLFSARQYVTRYPSTIIPAFKNQNSDGYFYYNQDVESTNKAKMMRQFTNGNDIDAFEDVIWGQNDGTGAPVKITLYDGQKVRIYFSLLKLFLILCVFLHCLHIMF